MSEKIKVFLTAGHGKDDEGGTWGKKDGVSIYEGEFNLTVMLACKKILEEHNIDVKCSRLTNDEYDPFKHEAAEALDFKPRIAFSIHHNGSDDHKGIGFEIFYLNNSINSENSKRLANLVVKGIDEAGLTLAQRGVKTENYGFLTRTKSLEVSVLAEGFFMDNPKDMEAYGDRLEEFGEVYAKAILEYLGIQYQEKPTNQNFTEAKNYSQLTEIIANTFKDIVEYDNNNNVLFPVTQDKETGKITITNEELLKIFKDDSKNFEGIITNDEYAKSLVIALENSNKDANEFKLKMRTILKSIVITKKKIVAFSSPQIVIQTSSDAFSEVTEEEIQEKLESKSGPLEIVNYYRQTYNNDAWNKNVLNSPETLNFWFDFMSTKGALGQYSVQAIGSRPKAVNDDKITAIYFQETPSVLFLTEDDYQKLSQNRKDYNDMTGYTFINLQPFMENYFTISAQGKSAKNELDSLLYQHSSATEAVNLTAVPIYYLQPNTKINIRDKHTKINGEFIVNKVTIPLQYNGTTAITTTKAVDRIY